MNYTCTYVVGTIEKPSTSSNEYQQHVSMSK